MWSLFSVTNWAGLAIPGKETTTGTFPTNVVLEKDRFGGEDLGAVGTGCPTDGVGRFGAAAGRSSATVSWRSCAHCPPLASDFEGLIPLVLSLQHRGKVHTCESFRPR